MATFVINHVVNGRTELEAETIATDTESGTVKLLGADNLLVAVVPLSNLVWVAEVSATGRKADAAD